ncbi:MAG: hypothetical protein BHV99_06390 [Clostridium sp. 26_21]|nr:MAG: hypothetical protein BHV99_06390 [Clostridium sp. 26_21]
MEKVRFTVAISAYNIEEYVKRAIDSVLNQTFKNYELLVIDDCSTDSTVKIIKETIGKKGRLLQTPKNSGTAAASRNIAIENAQGEYLLFLDGDDELFSENTLAEIDQHIGKNKYDIIYLGYENVGHTENYYRISTKENSTRKARLICDESFSVSSKVWNVKFLKENSIKFKEGMYYEDELFSIKSNILSQKTTYGEFPIFKYHRNREGSVMTKPTVKKCSDWYRMLAEVTDLYEITPDEDRKYLLSFLKNESDSIPLRVENIIEALRENRKTKVLPKRNYKFIDVLNDEE